MIYSILFAMLAMTPQTYLDTVAFVSGLMDQHVNAQTDPVQAQLDRDKARRIQQRLRAASVVLMALNAKDQELLVLTRQHHQAFKAALEEIKNAKSNARARAAIAKIQVAARAQEAIAKIHIAAREQAVARFRDELEKAEQLMGRDLQ